MINNQEMQILLADDDPDDRDFFVEAVSQSDLDFAVHEVENGHQLMELLATITPLMPVRTCTSPNPIFLKMSRACWIKYSRKTGRNLGNAAQRKTSF